MGMFDWIECKYPIPELEGLTFEKDFQTKDFESCMDNYKIDEDGQLWRRFIKREITPENERPFYGTDRWPEFAFMGSIREVTGTEKWEQWPSHGGVLIYTSIKDNNVYDWVDIHFLFSSGKVKDYVITFRRLL